VRSKTQPSPTREEQWLRQWRDARIALAEQRKKDLRAMTREQALAASDALLNLAEVSRLHPSRLSTSGLVEQQALFKKLVSD
jgi:hypothetical protein